jgi:hypothetical protein
MLGGEEHEEEEIFNRPGGETHPLAEGLQFGPVIKNVSV